MQTREDIAWAAGLFEGEGWWGPRGKTSAEAVLGSTDLDVVARFHAIVGFGVIRTESRANGHKTLYRWSVATRSEVVAFIALMWPWLGERRKDRAAELLERLAKCPGRKRDGKRYLRVA